MNQMGYFGTVSRKICFTLHGSDGCLSSPEAHFQLKRPADIPDQVQEMGVKPEKKIKHIQIFVTRRRRNILM